MNAHRPQRNAADRTGWVGACATGELVGFVPPAATGACLFWIGAPEGVLIAGLVLAGIGEGAILGAFQNRVVVRLFPNVEHWIVATAAAAGIAWLMGMGGSSLLQVTGPIGLLLVVPGWIVGLLAMGVFQSRRLRAAVDDPGSWVWYTSGAWMLGVSIPVVVLSVIPNGAHPLVHAVAAVVSAVAMGITVGLITNRPLIEWSASSARVEPKSVSGQQVKAGFE